MLKLSIISINLNNLAGLQKTMDSVFAQTFTDYEYIIIDGGSTDGSKELIENNANKLVYWVSEKDKGIYNAMNKGISKAKGEYLLFLNSGDYLVSNDVVAQLYNLSDGCDIIYADLKIDDKIKSYFRELPEKLSFSFFLENTLPHQSTFIKRNLFSKIGLYNETLKSTSDWEFFIHAICKYNATYKYVPINFACFNTDGISSQRENWVWILKDKKAILEKEYSAFLDDYSRLKKLEQVEKKFRNIENSRIWKLRSQIFNSSLGKLIFRNKE